MHFCGFGPSPLHWGTFVWVAFVCALAPSRGSVGTLAWRVLAGFHAGCLLTGASLWAGWLGGYHRILPWPIGRERLCTTRNLINRQFKPSDEPPQQPEFVCWARCLWMAGSDSGRGRWNATRGLQRLSLVNPSGIQLECGAGVPASRSRIGPAGSPTSQVQSSITNYLRLMEGCPRRPGHLTHNSKVTGRSSKDDAFP